MKAKKLLVASLLTLGVLVRLYGFQNPIADWHSHRQADTLSVSKNLLNQAGSLLVPTYHDLSSVQSGKSNPEGYRMVEFPIYNFFASFVTRLTPLTIGQSSRMVNLVLSIFTAMLIYRLSNLWGLILALFLPFGIYYNHTTIPETTGIFFLTLAVYFLESKSLLFFIPLSLCLLIKPYFGIIVFPYLFYQLISTKTKLTYLILSIVSCVPLILWRKHIQSYPEGIPANTWLFQQGFGQEKFVAFQPYWFRWLFWERLTKLILGYTLIPILLVSLKTKRNLLYLLGIILYFVIIARGNVQHDYYQTIILPFLIIIIASGLAKLNKYLAIILVVLAIGTTGYKVKEYYKINNPSIVEAGNYVDKNLPKNSLIIAPYTGDTALLYQTNRSGWPTEIYDFDTIFNEHPNRPIYLVSVNFDTYTNWVMKKYKNIYSDNKFVILEIKP